MASVRMKAVVVDTSYHRLRRATQTQPTPPENENAVARMSANSGVARWPPMQQISFMHLLHLDVEAKKLVRLLDDLSTEYGARLASGQPEDISIVVKLYGLACYLRQCRDSWLDFCRRSEWAGKRFAPKDEDRGEAMRYVLKYVCDLRAHAGPKIPADIFLSLKLFWVNRASSEDVAKAVRTTGSLAAIRALERRASRRRPTGPAKKLTMLVNIIEVAAYLDRAAVGEVLRLRVVKQAGGNKAQYEVLRVKTREVSPPS